MDLGRSAGAKISSCGGREGARRTPVAARRGSDTISEALTYLCEYSPTDYDYKFRCS